jgi:hypothetical protein
LKKKKQEHLLTKQFILKVFVNLLNRFPQKKTEKRKPFPQGRREGMSRLPAKKFLPYKIKTDKKLFYRNPEGLAFTDLDADLSSLFFFGFLLVE